MRNKLITILTAIIIAVSSSCQSVVDLSYGSNSNLKDKNHYLNKFEQSGIDSKQVYFVQEQSVDSKLEFYLGLHGNKDYYFFGTVYVNDKVLFKANLGDEFGCHQIIKTIQDDKNYPFKVIPSNKESALKDYMFFNSRNEQFEYTALTKRTAILIYHHNMGNLFFKDTEDLIDLINSDPNLDLAVLVTDIN